MHYAIETFSLTKNFTDWWGRTKVCAVNNLNLKVNTNEVFGLLGPNGSGKTTTLKMLLGLLRPTKGYALCLGGSSSDPKISAKIGFMPEESYLYKYLTARETLDFYGQLFSLPSKIRKIRIDALLDMVGLKAVANRPVGTYSKGMARRIGLAQALINDPDLLILDEPTTGLDPIGTRQIKDLIIQLAKRGKTVLLCSHLLADVEDVCDRISILYGGSVQTEGQVSILLRQTDKTQITIDSIDDAALEEIKQVLHSQEKNYTIASPMEKLESFFIRTVTEAQKAQLPTSGAVSTTQIGEFLAAEQKTKSILDKLVSEPIAPEEPIETEPVETNIVVESRPEEKILNELIGQQPAPQTKPVVQQQTQDASLPKETTINKDILNQLTESQTDQENQNKPKEAQNNE